MSFVACVFSIVTYATREEAVNALSTLNKTVLGDRPLSMKFYTTSGGRR